MELKAGDKIIKIVFRTRSIVDITDALRGKSFEESFFKALNEKNLEALSKIIFFLAETEEKKKYFKNNLEVYDFIDDYKSETGKTYDEIFAELAKSINDEGFFSHQFTEEEMKSKMNDELSGIDLQPIIQSATEKAMSHIAENQIAQTNFSGFVQ